MRKTTCLAAVGLIAGTLLFVKSGVGKPFDDELAIRGSDFMPPQPFVLGRQNSGLANWSLVEDDLLAVKKIRVIGFAGKAGQDKVDWTSEDPAVLSVISEGLVSSRMRRWALSDFSDGRGGVFGGHLGAILISLDEGRELVIGVSKTGFYFGVVRGTTHQMFESWLLAKQIKEVLQKHLGRELDAAVFATLSGERNIEEQRQLYNKLSDAQKRD